MRYLIRVFAFNCFAVWLTGELLPGFLVHGNWQAVLVAGLTLTVLMIFFKPILRILFIPINILTLGFMSWIINVIVIYLLTVLVPEVDVVAWRFGGVSYGGFALPGTSVPYIASLIITSLLISIITNLLHWTAD